MPSYKLFSVASKSLLDSALILGATLVNSILLRNIYMACAFILTVWIFISMYLDHIDKG